MSTSIPLSYCTNEFGLARLRRGIDESRLGVRTRLPHAPFGPRRERILTRAVLLSLVLASLAVTSAWADLFSLTASGTITSNGSGDGSIAVGTPWILELVYDTDAPDLDFEQTGTPDPTFGLYTNTGTPPALMSFHFQAGDYEVAIDDPADFATLSEIIITFTSVYAIDINIVAPASFPDLAGGEVSFHADFNDFSSRPIFESDALPTDPDIDLESFDETTVSLLPPIGTVSSTALSSLEITPVPEPSVASLEIAGFFAVLELARHKTAVSGQRRNASLHTRLLGQVGDLGGAALRKLVRGFTES